MQTQSSNIRYILLLGVLLISTFLVYWPGLSGSFLLDDFSNLEKLGEYNGIDGIDKLILFLETGIAGPTGRPISLLSFLLNASDWPADPWSFKLTNVFIHIISGLFLYILTTKLLSVVYPSEYSKCRWIALLSTGVWLLLPFWISTTLYIVQRMTQLSALFVLMALVAYTHGRMQLEENTRKAYIWMSLALIIGGGLALLSKENGGMLPLFILTLEFCVFYPNTQTRPNKIWAALFLWIPTFLIVSFLLKIGFSQSGYSSRSFDVEERLLTECRILFDYLYHIFVPHLQTSGLFNDNYLISKNLFEPWNTLPAVMGVLLLIGIGFWSRSKFPTLSLAILFFFAGHSLESTTLALELYFEHRNYLPAIFLFLPIAHFIVYLATKKNLRLGMGIAGLLLLVFAATTWQRASLWGNPTQLAIVWAAQNPFSQRAQRWAAGTFETQGNIDVALRILEKAKQNMADNVAIHLHHLRLTGVYRGIDHQQFEQALNFYESNPYDLRDPELVNVFLQDILQENIRGLDDNDALSFLIALENNPGIKDKSEYRPWLNHFRGIVYISAAEPEKALASFNLSIQLLPVTDAGLLQTAMLASNGYYEQALAHLTLVEKMFDQSQKQHSADYYLPEFQRLRKILENDILESKNQSAPEIKM